MSKLSLKFTTSISSFESISEELLSWIMLFVIDRMKSEFFLNLVCKSWHRCLCSTTYWTNHFKRFFLVQVYGISNNSSSYTQLPTNWRSPNSSLFPKLIYVNDNHMKILSEPAEVDRKEPLFSRLIANVPLEYLMITDPTTIRDLSDYTYLKNVKRILIDLSPQVGHQSDNMLERIYIKFSDVKLLLGSFSNEIELILYNIQLNFDVIYTPNDENSSIKKILFEENGIIRINKAGF